jgi:tetratricopeptide (TPR) repeat protein
MNMQNVFGWLVILNLIIVSPISFAQIDDEKAIAPPNKTAKMALKLAFNAFKNKTYFTSASYMKLYLMQDKVVSSSAAKLLDAVIRRTNVFPFLDIPFDILSSIPYSQNVPFALAKKYFFKKDYANAIVYLRRIQPKTFFYLPSLQQLAGLYQMIGDFEQAQIYTDKCLKESSKKVNRKIQIFEQKAEYIYDTCQALQARLSFKTGNLDKSLKEYKSVPLNSYSFPQSTFEVSWIHFSQKDYMRSIGKNLTFQSPLMSDYFIPEAELVKTLSYLDLCYYEDGVGVIKHFDQEVKSKVNEFIALFNLRSKDRYPFAKLLTDKSSREKLGDSFFNRQLNVIWARPGFQTIKYYLQRLNNEKEIIDRAGSNDDRKAFTLAYRDFLEFFNDFVKMKMVKTAKNIIKLNNLFTEIELNIYSTVKYGLYDVKNKKSQEKGPEKFDVKKIKRNVKQYYWNFAGEFWADELGSFIPFLENQCGKGDIYEKAIKNFE